MLNKHYFFGLLIEKKTAKRKILWNKIRNQKMQISFQLLCWLDESEENLYSWIQFASIKIKMPL